MKNSSGTHQKQECVTDATDVRHGKDNNKNDTFTLFIRRLIEEYKKYRSFELNSKLWNLKEILNGNFKKRKIFEVQLVPH